MARDTYFVEYNTEYSHSTLEEHSLGEARRSAKKALENGAFDIYITKEEMQYNPVMRRWGYKRLVATLVWKEDYITGERFPVNTRFSSYHGGNVPVEEWERFCMIDDVIRSRANDGERLLQVYLTNGRLVTIFPEGTKSYRMVGSSDADKKAASVVVDDYIDWLHG